MTFTRGIQMAFVLSSACFIFTATGCEEEKSTPPAASLSAGPVAGFTTEAGGQATFQIHLDVKPSADVVLDLSSSDTTEGTVSPATLTFTADNFDAPQTVTLDGVDDDVADGNQIYQVSVAPSSGDARWGALAASQVDVTNIDDETAGILFGQVSGSTTEAGDQATFTVVLTSEPTAAVTLALESDDLSEGGISPATLDFNAVNWNAPQQILVTGVNDDQADGNQAYSVVISSITSADTDYAALTLGSVPVTNIDDETAGILVTVQTTTTTETGGQALFDVVLTSQPFDDVVVSFDSDDASEGSIATTSLTFTDQDWNAPQQVAVVGLNDDLADGDQAYQVVFAQTASNDAAYALLTPSPVDVTNIDNDSAGVTITEASAPTTEAGGQATFEVVLNSQPTANVTIPLDTNDASEGTPDKTSLLFTDQDWFVPQEVTVTGLDDPLNDGFQIYGIAFGTISSGDGDYAALVLANVKMTNIDDETPGFIVSEPSSSTSENAGTADFTVVLTKQPSASVTVNFDTSNASEGMPDVTSLTFTNNDFDSPQTVTVTGQDDSNIDGDQPYRIDFSATTSADSFYDGLIPASVRLVNADNDASISFTPNPIAPDFVITGSESNGSEHYFPSNGDGTFGTQSNIANTDVVDGVDVADMDGDGDNDFLLCDGASGDVTLYTNAGPGFAETIVATNVSTGYCTNLRIEDMDLDGAPDFVVGDEGTPTLHIFLQTSLNTFTMTATLDTSWATSSIFGVATGDVDGDGLPDILAMGYQGAAGGDIHFYKGDGNGGAGAPAKVADVNQGSTTGLALFDLENDGDLDIVAGGSSAGEHFLFLNDATGVFTAQGAAVFDVNAQSGLDATDIDGDGDQDLLIATWSTQSLVLVENLGGTLAAPVTISALGANSIGVGAPPR